MPALKEYSLDFNTQVAYSTCNHSNKTECLLILMFTSLLVPLLEVSIYFIDLILTKENEVIGVIGKPLQMIQPFPR